MGHFTTRSTASSMDGETTRNVSDLTAMPASISMQAGVPKYGDNLKRIC